MKWKCITKISAFQCKKMPYLFTQFARQLNFQTINWQTTNKLHSHQARPFKRPPRLTTLLQKSRLYSTSWRHPLSLSPSSNHRFSDQLNVRVKHHIITVITHFVQGQMYCVMNIWKHNRSPHNSNAINVRKFIIFHCSQCVLFDHSTV